jgi:predicted nuclease with TOPRIM domain
MVTESMLKDTVEWFREFESYAFGLKSSGDSREALIRRQEALQGHAQNLKDATARVDFETQSKREYLNSLDNTVNNLTKLLDKLKDEALTQDEQERVYELVHELHDRAVGLLEDF